MIRLLLVLAMLCGTASATRAQTCWALVVVVSHYTTLPSLANPVSDAVTIADALRSVGFRVTSLIDPTSTQLRTAIARAETEARATSVALFFFAGHAVSFHNSNMLLGVDADPRDEESLRMQGVPLTDFTRRKQVAERRLLLIDACRTPLSFLVPGVEHGHAPEAAGVQTVFEFSAGPEQEASDGNGSHSPFALAFLQAMRTPGLELNPLLVQVSRYMDVYGLQDAMRDSSVQRGLDASQTLAVLGDIPAPVLRRHALSLLLPSLLASISAPEAIRLLASIDGSARAEAVEVLRPCMTLPLGIADLDDVLSSVRSPERAALAQQLSRPAPADACPATRS